MLAAPFVRTLAGLLVLLGVGLPALVPLALATAAWSRTRIGRAPRTTALATLAAVAGLLVLDGLVGVLLCDLLLLLWAAEDVADWWSDRLVVTDKRVYRRYGVFTRHAPSVSLTAVAYLDAAVPPLGRALGYGTLLLDSAAQRDAPLSRFDLVPDVVAVSHEVLRLRAAAMPRFPPLPH
ncbi:MAG: hypothetical protein JWM64_867, partial [Frankiales bacterium]|nr:hypothetical protein [Frankiales bacterium]